MGLPLDGVDEPAAKLLRENAEKIAINYELFAGRLGLPSLPVADRAGSLDAVRAALDRLEALGASKDYLAGWRQWLAEAGDRQLRGAPRLSCQSPFPR
jgi:hypothetical protein